MRSGTNRICCEREVSSFPSPKTGVSNTRKEALHSDAIATTVEIKIQSATLEPGETSHRIPLDEQPETAMDSNRRDVRWMGERPTERANASVASLRDLVGEFGVALFNPLDLAMDAAIQTIATPNAKTTTTVSTMSIRTTELDSTSPRIVWEVTPNQPQAKVHHEHDPAHAHAHEALPATKPTGGPRSVDSCANLTLETITTQASIATTPPSLIVDIPDSDPEDYFSALALDLDCENPQDLRDCPRILSDSMMRQLHDEGLSESLQQCRWERCFAIGRDGDAFLTLVDKAAPFSRTFVVLQTVEGHVLGGFACMPWKKYGAAAYYGTGQSFLFASHPAKNKKAAGKARDDASGNDASKPLHIYRWTGTNDFCQICDVESARLGMGGGADFGFMVQDNFWRGRSGACKTFGNPPLVDGPGGTFEVQAMEVYGLKSLSESFHASFRHSLSSSY